ncbi:MAG: helix-turn-helix transcriptional regulator [Planctomycetota bacterium]|jgi:predicted DNA-binding transcriptional regulator YafY
MKHSRISRVIQILTTLQAGKKYAVSDLSKIFGTSRRTIFRDLKELRIIGIPYHYDTKTGCYTIEPEFFLPPIDLNLQEALSLLLLAQKASNQIQLPFKNSALLAALKIENNMPAKIRRYCNTKPSHNCRKLSRRNAK